MLGRQCAGFEGAARASSLVLLSMILHAEHGHCSVAELLVERKAAL